MSLENDIKSIHTHVKNVYDSLELLGATLPQDKNIENLAGAIETIPLSAGTGDWDPENPTLDGLKYAIDNDLEIPIGTEIPDTYDGQDNPLIVAEKLTSSNNSLYGGAVGIILLRKFVEPMSVFGGTRYRDSTVKELLNTTYLENCSAKLKSLISPITVYTNLPNGLFEGNMWFLMSAMECGLSNTVDGIMWQLWIDKLGIKRPDSTNYEQRICRDRNGIAQRIWTRSNSGSRVSFIITEAGGGTTANAEENVYGVLPACFIAKTSE